MKIQACSPLALQRSSSRLSCVSHACRVAAPVIASTVALGVFRAADARQRQRPRHRPGHRAVLASSGISDSTWLGMRWRKGAAEADERAVGRAVGQLHGYVQPGHVGEEPIRRQIGRQTLLATIENCGSTAAITIRSWSLVLVSSQLGYPECRRKCSEGGACRPPQGHISGQSAVHACAIGRTRFQLEQNVCSF